MDGMMMSAARMANSVSQTEICLPLFWISAPFFMYEPYVIMMPMARDIE